MRGHIQSETSVWDLSQLLQSSTKLKSEQFVCAETCEHIVVAAREP